MIFKIYQKWSRKRHCCKVGRVDERSQWSSVDWNDAWLFIPVGRLELLPRVKMGVEKKNFFKLLFSKLRIRSLHFKTGTSITLTLISIFEWLWYLEVWYKIVNSTWKRVCLHANFISVHTLLIWIDPTRFCKSTLSYFIHYILTICCRIRLEKKEKENWFVCYRQFQCQSVVCRLPAIQKNNNYSDPPTIIADCTAEFIPLNPKGVDLFYLATSKKKWRPSSLPRPRHDLFSSDLFLLCYK
jgi:hypothetical protein